MVDYSRGSIAVAHNGNIVNAQIIKDELEAYGSIFQTTMDTEIIVHLLATSKANSLLDRISDSLNRIKGAYCLLFLTETRMVAVRDPNGFRPLCLGKLGNSYVVASESCALDLIDAEFIREIEPGEVIIITNDGVTSHFPLQKRAHAMYIRVRLFCPTGLPYLWQERLSGAQGNGTAVGPGAPGRC